VQADELVFGESLGSGSFGAVYKGTYRGQKVAIKQLFEQGLQSHVLKELEKEIKSLSQVRHERLVAFIGACMTPGKLCIVTELMEYGSLYELVHVRKERVDQPTKIRLCAEITEGVGYLHGRSPVFVHRDLKSLNVVLGIPLTAKLCDFGLTQSMEKTHISRRRGEGEQGSPRYMAPELFDTRGKITEKIDCWALGCLFVEIFSERVPYEACQNLQQLVAVLLVRKELPPMPAALDSRVKSICVRLLSFDVATRLPAIQALEQLRALL
jgi:serine/threonine protein kinase